MGIIMAMMSKHELRTTHYLQALQPASYVMWHNDTGPDISTMIRYIITCHDRIIGQTTNLNIADILNI